MDKYNAARADFEQRMLDSAMVRPPHTPRGGPVLGDVSSGGSRPRGMCPWGCVPHPGVTQPRGRAGPQPCAQAAGRASIGVVALGEVAPRLRAPFWGHASSLGTFQPPPQGHARCPWGHLGDIIAPFSPQRFQEVEEAHLRHMKGLIGSYSHSVEDTHVQIGQVRPPALCGVPPPLFCHPMSPPPPRATAARPQVHEEFKQNVENIGTEMLLRRFAESKGTGRERPGELVAAARGGPHLL